MEREEGLSCVPSQCAGTACTLTVCTGRAKWAACLSWEGWAYRIKAASLGSEITEGQARFRCVHSIHSTVLAMFRRSKPPRNPHNKTHMLGRLCPETRLCLFCTRQDLLHLCRTNLAMYGVPEPFSASFLSLQFFVALRFVTIIW